MPLDEAPFFYTKRRINVPAEYEKNDFLVGGNNTEQWGPVERGADCSKFGKGFFRAKYDWTSAREKQWEDRSERFHQHDTQRGLELQRQSRRIGYDIVTGEQHDNTYVSQSRFHPSGRRTMVDTLPPEASALEATQRMRDTSLRYHRPPSATLNNYDRQHRSRILVESGLMDLENKRTSSVIGVGNDKIPSLGVAEALSQSNYGGIRSASILDYAKHEKRTYASIVDSASRTTRDPFGESAVETSSGYSPMRQLRAQTASGRLRNDTTFHMYKENVRKTNYLESVVNEDGAIPDMRSTLRPNTALGLTYRSTRRNDNDTSMASNENIAPSGNQDPAFLERSLSPGANATNGTYLQSRPVTSPGMLRTLHAKGYTRSRYFPYYQRTDSSAPSCSTERIPDAREESINYNEALLMARNRKEILATMYPTNQERDTLRMEINPQGKSGVLDRTVWDVSLSPEDVRRRQNSLRRQPNRVFDTTSQPQILPVVPDREARGTRELNEVLRSRPPRPIDRPTSFTLTAMMLRESRAIAQKREDIEAVRRLPLNVMD